MLEKPRNQKQLKNVGITLTSTNHEQIITVVNNPQSRGNRGLFPTFCALLLNALIGYCIFAEFFVHPFDADTYRDVFLLSIIQLAVFAFLLVILFRYFSDTTITLTKNTILIHRKIPLGLFRNYKRKTKNLRQIKQYLDMGDSETITGVELVFSGEWNVVIGQHLDRAGREQLIRTIGIAVGKF